MESKAKYYEKERQNIFIAVSFCCDRYRSAGIGSRFSAGEETFISETTEQEGDVSEASAIFEDTVDSDSE